MRYAIYFAPAEDDPLMQQAAAWLGRDVFTGAEIAHPQSGGLTPATIADITSSPRRYGFHATLKAPFRLAEGQTEAGLIAALARFATTREAFSVPEMMVGNLDGFFAIIPREPSSELDRFAGEVVTAFETFRAPLSDADLARRNPEHLSPDERANLHRWGYPYVFDAFRFHMTLTNRIATDERPAIEAKLRRLFDPVLPRPFPIDGLAVYVEPEPGVPFTVLRRTALVPQRERNSA